MGKNILLAFDDSENALRAAEYVAGIFGPDHTVTLFGVVPDTAAMCEMNSPELTPYFKAEQRSFCTLEDKKKGLLKAAMDRARDVFLAAGFEDKRIVLKIQGKKSGWPGISWQRPDRAMTSSCWAGGGFPGSGNFSWEAFPRKC